MNTALIGEDPTIISDLKWLLNEFISIFVNLGDRVRKIGVIQALDTTASLKAVVPCAKIMICTANITSYCGSQALKLVGQSAGMVKDGLYAFGIFGAVNNFVNEKEGLPWWKKVSNRLLMVGSFFEVADFSKKYLGVTYFPGFSEVASAIGNSGWFQSIATPLIKHLFINRVKDLIILVNSIFSMLVDCFFFFFGSDKEREYLFSMRNVLDFLNHLGRALLICFGVSYFATLAFMITNLFFSVVSYLKVLFFP